MGQKNHDAGKKKNAPPSPLLPFQEDDQLRRKAEGGGASGAASGLQELLPFAGGAATAQSLRKVAAHDRERQDMLKVRVYRTEGLMVAGFGSR